MLEERQGGCKNALLVEAIGLLITFSIVLTILATEPVIRGPQLDLLEELDLAVEILFLVDYFSRLWIAPLKDGVRRGV